MLTRREALRTAAATGLAVPLLSACGDEDGAGTGADAVPGIDLVSAQVARSHGDRAGVPGVVDSMVALTADLWPHLAGPSADLALSPYSVAVALAMTANGAVGDTRTRMLEVLHVDSLAAANAGLAALTLAIEGLAGPVTLDNGRHRELELRAADALFGDRGETWEQGFLTVLAKEYGAGMRAVDFRHATEAARRSVNRWTSRQTDGRIPEILPQGAVDGLTRLVLVDALFFKAPWAIQFDELDTQRAAFRLPDGRRVQVPMMSTVEGATSVSGTSYRGARLPYAGHRLAMTLALATGHETDALAELVGDLAVGPGRRGVRLTMPRWTFRAASDLTAPLQELGMDLPFDPVRADFTAMTRTERLHLEDVLHQAFVAVDENGTEAAAATAAVMEATSGEYVPDTLVLDRPFLFAIHDTSFGTPLFVGRVADPS